MAAKSSPKDEVLFQILHKLTQALTEEDRLPNDLPQKGPKALVDFDCGNDYSPQQNRD